jgi:hypothetical protein
MSDNPITAIVDYLLNENTVCESYVYSGHQYFHLAEKFLEVEIDIMTDYDFPSAYLNTEKDVLFGWYCVIILQRRLYEAMRENHLGKAAQVNYMCDYLYVMEKKFNEKILAEVRNKPVKHLWIH